MRSKPHRAETIELRRGDQIVSSLFGAFGNALRETRLTAALAYIIASRPAPFLRLFGFPGRTQKITIEARHDLDRSDILIETTRGRGVIEAKVNSTDATAQVLKYQANWRAVLTSQVGHSDLGNHVHRVSWQRLASELRSLRRSVNIPQRTILDEFVRYLEEHGMARINDPVEVYAREINERTTLELFLKGRIYACDFEKSSRVSEALYFAPHFGQAIAKIFPGIGAGISYVAKIDDVVVIESFKEIIDEVRRKRGKVWTVGHRPLIDPLRMWSWKKGHKRSLLLLGEPRLLFNPPIKKDNLQAGHGYLSKRVFSFDALFEAWRH